MEETKANEIREGSVDYIVYQSEVMSKVMEQAKRVAQSDATVLLLGESGTGKELAAKFIHQSSPRRKGPFIQINCSAIPENLLEAEFFGYEAGSFTGGSSAGKKGLLEYANNGTVLLDEIGEMPYHMQAKILRMLQEKEIMRIGGNKTIKLNVRFIASTNANIPHLIREKKFRADLYYRISTAPIKIPPLRDRKEDIPLLIDYFLKEFNQIYHTCKRAKKSLSENLADRHWTGNIRELRNIIERLVIMTPSAELNTGDLLEVCAAQEGFEDEKQQEDAKQPKERDDFGEMEGKSLTEIMESYEKRVLAYFQERYAKKSDIAAALHVYPSTITRKLQQYGL